MEKIQNPEDKRLWVEALRSGKYAQGTEVLRSKDGKYCCLGVACVVLGRKIKNPLSGNLTSPDYQWLKKRLGIQDLEEFTGRNDGSYNPSTRAGVPEHTFAEIADFIEANY